jgi:uncharacterized protein with HEPN domain
MKQQDRDAANLWDIQKAAKLIRQFQQDKTYNDFNSDLMLRSAIERQLEIIGEAARRVSAEFREKHPEIPWRSIIALRNILIHEYGEVRLDRIWLIVTTHVLVLIDQIQPLIPSEPGEE